MGALRLGCMWEARGDDSSRGEAPLAATSRRPPMPPAVHPCSPRSEEEIERCCQVLGEVAKEVLK